MRLIATQQTWLKKSPLQAADLPPADKFKLEPRQTVDAKVIGGDGSGHWLIILEKAINGHFNWYVYKEHIKASPPLAVPFLPQTDNRVEPDRTCNISTHAMLVSYLQPKALPVTPGLQPDDVYAQMLRKFGDTTDHVAHTNLLKTLGIESEWRTDLGYSDLTRQLNLGYPIPVGILHRGSLANPTGGHILLVVGEYFGGFICQDPYGSLNDDYASSVKKGNLVQYSKVQFGRRWLDGSGSTSGWGRIVHDG